MAKDDYHVIVFKILTYLYQQLKKAEPLDPAMISPGSKACGDIPLEYWKYILENMQGEGLIRGLKKGNAKSGDGYIEAQLERIQITPKGINLLQDKSTVKMVNDLLKGVVRTIPGL